MERRQNEDKEEKKGRKESPSPLSFSSGLLICTKQRISVMFTHFEPSNRSGLETLYLFRPKKRGADLQGGMEDVPKVKTT